MAGRAVACREATLHILPAFDSAQHTLIAREGRVEGSYARQSVLRGKGLRQELHVVESAPSAGRRGSANVRHAICPPWP